GGSRTRQRADEPLARAPPALWRQRRKRFRNAPRTRDAPGTARRYRRDAPPARSRGGGRGGGNAAGGGGAPEKAGSGRGRSVEENSEGDRGSWFSESGFRG